MRHAHLSGIAGLILAFGAAVPAAAVVTTFATYTAIGGSNMLFVNSGTSDARLNDATLFSTSTATAVVPGGVLVNFSFLQPQLAPFVTNVAAIWTFNGFVAKNSPAVDLIGALIQPGVSSTFSLISTSAITVSGAGLTPTTYAAGSNLLSGSFTAGSISGQGSAGASFASGVLGSGTISFTSDFLTFANSTSLDRAQSLSAVFPSFAVDANGAFRTYRAVASGQFSSDPSPTISVPVVPEPESWAMFIAGFGLVGAASRLNRQRKRA
jgi:hypothetical protein